MTRPGPPLLEASGDTHQHPDAHRRDEFDPGEIDDDVLRRRHGGAHELGFRIWSTPGVSNRPDKTILVRPSVSELTSSTVQPSTVMALVGCNA